MEEYYKLYLTEIRRDGVNGIYVNQDRDKWRVPVNTTMKLRVP